MFPGLAAQLLSLCKCGYKPGDKAKVEEWIIVNVKWKYGFIARLSPPSSPTDLGTWLKWKSVIIVNLRTNSTWSLAESPVAPIRL